MPTLHPSERLGTHVGGRYEVRELLGEGGFSCVFRAAHTVTGREVALKILHPHLTATPEITERFLQEARAMVRIAHDGIVQVLDAGKDPDGSVFMALELLDGEPLEATLRRVKRLTWGESVSVCIDILGALAEAHRNGIIHRDIKPGNIFIVRKPDGSSQAKLLDFGIAHVASAGRSKLTAQGSILGTPEYMSPEQGRTANVGPPSDLWSVGIVLWECLTGQTPFVAEGVTEILLKIATTQAPPILSRVPGLPPAVAAVIDRSLARDVERRFRSAEEMRDAMRRAMRKTDEARAVALPATPSEPSRVTMPSGSVSALVVNPASSEVATPPPAMVVTVAPTLVVEAPPAVATVPSVDGPSPRGPQGSKIFLAPPEVPPPRWPRTAAAVTAVGLVGLVAWGLARSGGPSTASGGGETSSVPLASSRGSPLPRRFSLAPREHIAPPAEVATVDRRREFARHVAVSRHAGTTQRLIATCVGGDGGATLYVHPLTSGALRGSSPGLVACEGSDLAVVPDVTADGSDDLVAVAPRGGPLRVIDAQSLRPFRTLEVAGARGIAEGGSVQVRGEPVAIVYAEPDGPEGVTEVVAVSAVSARTLWRVRGAAPLARIGRPDELGLAVGGDADGDGVGDVVAGLAALSAAAPAGGEGRCVQVYSGVDGQALWAAPVCDPSTASTQSLSLGPDVNGDGRGDVAVGTPGGAQGPSTVTILSGADGRVLQRVAAPGDGLAAGFGRPLALAGDLDGDHAPDLAVGSAGAAAGFTVFTASSGRPLGSRRLGEGELRLLGVPPLVATEVWSLVVGDPAAGIDVYVTPRSEEPP